MTWDSSFVAACVLFVLGCWACVLLVHYAAPDAQLKRASAQLTTSFRQCWKQHGMPAVAIRDVRLIEATADTKRVEVVLVFFSVGHFVVVAKAASGASDLPA
jgi:hypothetical protein